MIAKLVKQEQERQVKELGNGGPLKAARKVVARHIRSWRKKLGSAKVRQMLRS